ncbi:MAG: PhzF family phenazine biosynthesis protein [Bacteroidota bacterium]
MFGPYYGIPEESATGMAAGPLACYLHDKLGQGKKHFLIEQGYFMQHPSPSLLIADLEIKKIRSQA